VTFGSFQETQRSEGEAARKDIDLWQLKKKPTNEQPLPKTPKSKRKLKKEKQTQTENQPKKFP